MPHDRDGNELKPGDKVVIHGTVRSVCPGEFCNIEFVTDETMPGNGEPSVIAAINAKQVVKKQCKRLPDDVSIDESVEAKLAKARRET